MEQVEPPTKRRKLNVTPSENVLAASEHRHQVSPHQSLDRPISPPLPRRGSPAVSYGTRMPEWGFDNIPRKTPTETQLDFDAQQDQPEESPGTRGRRYVPSPIQLTHIHDLAPSQNADAVKLKDILGDPMIKECWNFNFLFDLDFVMNQFDEDVKNLVKVKIVHGFWKKEDANRIALLATERYTNIELISAYIPDPFGTHHSKMLVLFRHDDQAQVIIHTANMISKDWGNMTQAVWRSPLLPLLPSEVQLGSSSEHDLVTYKIGSGERFKVDLLRYFKAYGKRLANMTQQLMSYDFSAIRAAFIGSAPSRQKPADAKPSEQTSFGWLGVQEILSSVPVTTTSEQKAAPPHIVMQVSSIATLGAAPTWLSQFQSVLSGSASTQSLTDRPLKELVKASTFFKKPEAYQSQERKSLRPSFSIIFPTPDEIRTSLDGYASGGSIHMKLQSQQQQKQLEYMHPLFCHWKAPLTVPNASPTMEQRGQALRGSAAPHIKTYIRFTDQAHRTMDWAMVTSANLSKQAWGDVVNKRDEIWIQSWEAGVVVWPALFAEPEEGGKVVMVPVFGKDTPGTEAGAGVGIALDDMEKEKMIGFRMPYDLPLQPYAADDKPWCATMQYAEPDWSGRSWGGY
ncbi:tyrosyl-DNA phosphodiesterase I [Ampelomyces quisqualis]|uniref:Tyrosyl-DNA phosphodiesterase I n=1 Tax=Ampelomyces quisqualis TaxID=50730 RepID=A0A6A5QE84_AMPQU|nr:tyrosyl-DNA phosphodiesterase I [Ampelomyces quisqualis]